MTADPSEPQPLPGLEDLDAIETRRRGIGGVGEVERGVRRTLRALREANLITEVDAGRTAVAVSLARMMATKEATGRGSTFSNDARLLVELLDSLSGEASKDAAEFEAKLSKAMADWETVVKGSGSP